MYLQLLDLLRPFVQGSAAMLGCRLNLGIRTGITGSGHLNDPRSRVVCASRGATAGT